MNSFKAAV